MKTFLKLENSNGFDRNLATFLFKFGLFDPLLLSAFAVDINSIYLDGLFFYFYFVAESIS